MSGRLSHLIPTCIVCGPDYHDTGLLENQILPGLANSNWDVADAILRMRDDAERDLDELLKPGPRATSPYLDRNETAFVEHMLCTVLEMERDGRHISPHGIDPDGSCYSTTSP